MRTHVISAICTPLQDDDSLHVEGLVAHLDDQWRHGIAGVLIGGTMGLMQLLDDAKRLPPSKPKSHTSQS